MFLPVHLHRLREALTKLTGTLEIVVIQHAMPFNEIIRLERK